MNGVNVMLPPGRAVASSWCCRVVETKDVQTTEPRRVTDSRRYHPLNLR
jgi:hypothetical protein